MQIGHLQSNKSQGSRFTLVEIDEIAQNFVCVFSTYYTRRKIVQHNHLAFVTCPLQLNGKKCINQ